MSEQMVMMLLAGAGGWVLRHLGLGAPKGTVTPLRSAIAGVSPAAGLTGGIKGEIESIVKAAVEDAMRTAIADIRSGLIPAAASPPGK